jgi:outer membrane protein assembly factor BamB
MEKFREIRTMKSKRSLAPAAYTCSIALLPIAALAQTSPNLSVSSDIHAAHHAITVAETLSHAWITRAASGGVGLDLDSPWPKFHGDLRNTGSSTNGLPAADWSRSLGSPILSSPCVGLDGTIFVGTNNGYMNALDGSNGNILWRRKTGARVTSSPVISKNGILYFGSVDKNIYALDATNGNVIWTYKTAGAVTSSPLLSADGNVYVGSYDRYLYALNKATGTLAWRYKTPGAIESSPTINSTGILFIGSNDGSLTAIDTQTHLKVWSYLTDDRIHSSPALNDSKVYFGSFDGYVYALDQSNGNLVWRYLTDWTITSSPSIDSVGTVLIGSDDGFLNALDGKTGTLKWNYAASDSVASSPAIDPYGYCYVGADDGSLYSQKINDPTVQGVVPGLSLIESSPALTGDGIVFGTLNGQIQRRRTASIRWKGWQLFTDNLVNQRSASSITIANASNYANYRVRHTNRSNAVIRRVIVGYSNGIKTATAVEGVINNEFSVQGSIEKVGADVNQQTARRTPITFRGLASATFTPGTSSTILWSDPIDVSIQPGETFFERVAVKVPTNGFAYPTSQCVRGGTATFGINNGEGLTNSTTPKILDGSGSITVQANSSRYSACVILGLTEDGSVISSAAIQGDSTVNGTDDAQMGLGYGGYLERALTGYPFSRQTAGGEFAMQGVTDSNTYLLSALTDWANHVFWAYGSMDVGSTSVALMKQYALTAQLKAAQKGQVFTACTLLPRNGSKDNHRTLSGEFLTSYEATRVAYNDWIRNTTATGFVAQANAQCLLAGFTSPSVFALDVCPAIEVNRSNVLTKNGGFFIPPTILDVYTGTSSQLSSNSLTDATKNWPVNALRDAGYAIGITSGTGAGQVRAIFYNTATGLWAQSLWSPTLAPSSQYTIGAWITIDGTHLAPTGHKIVADSIKPTVTSIMGVIK